jgi:hypothetical protein
MVNTEVANGFQFSLRSLLILTAVAAILLGLGRMIVPAALAVAPDLTMLAWLGGLVALAGAVALVYFYANR